MPRLAANPAIPLRCNICPRYPTFSDVSHLLTHVSSKGHLAHKFNLSIQADQPAIHHQLAVYDQWFNNYGIARLLAERLAAKETKKNNGGKRKKTVPAQPNHQNDEVQQSENIHPALYDQVGNQGYRAPIPAMQPLGQRHMNQWASVYHNQGTPAPASEWGDESVYETPTMRNNVPNFGGFHPENGSGVAEENGEHNGVDLESQQGEEEVETHRVPDAAQLKGTIWPGMGIFDSATPEQQKRRNQKKDSSILAQMIYTSTNTEPTEVVFNSDFTFRRNKDIFGPNNDSDEEDFIQRTPMKRKARGKAMKKVDGNMPRFRKLAAAEGRKSGLRSNAKNYDEQSQVGTFNRSFGPALSNSGSTSSRTTPSTTTSRYEPSIDEEDDYFGEFPARKKSKKLRVYRDEGEPLTIENAEPQSPARTESPLEDHRFEEFPLPAEYYHQDPVKQGQASPVPSAYRQNQADGKYLYDRSMDYGRELQENDNSGSDHLFVTEQETPRQNAQYGLAPPQFAPAFTQQQYFAEMSTINPLKSQGQAHHQLQSRSDYHSTFQASHYDGDFKPVNVSQLYYPPPSAYLPGGSASGTVAKPEALNQHLGSEHNPFYN